MRLFGRRKKNPRQSYYDYYGQTGVVPDTIEYYLELGEEVEAEDIYWDFPTAHDDVETVVGDNSTIVSYKDGHIPMLTIVDASTNVPIVSSTFRHASSTGDASLTTSNTGTSSSRKGDSTSTDSDSNEPGDLEVDLSDHQCKMETQDSMDETRTYCTISTIGFKSAVASAAAAQAFAAQYVKYKSKGVSCDFDDANTTSPSNGIISAPRKNPSGNGSLEHSRIILHADAAGENTASMSRVLSSVQASTIIKGQSNCNPFTDIAAPATTCANEFAPSTSDVLKIQTIMESTARDMPSLLDDEMSSLRASNTEKSIKQTNTEKSIKQRRSFSSYTEKSIKQRRSFFQARSSWLSRRRTGSTRRTRFDDESTIATRMTTKLADLIEDSEKAAVPTPPSLKSFEPVTLSVLYDDKRNEVAWLRCAPRRRSFDFPIHKKEEQQEQKEQQDSEEEDSTTEASLPATVLPQVGQVESRVDDAPEERDLPPPSPVNVDERDIPERGKSILGEDCSMLSTDDESDDSQELKTAGSTISMYKRKLADLQRRHEALIKLIQDF